MHGEFSYPGKPLSYIDIEALWNNTHDRRSRLRQLSFDLIAFKPPDYPGAEWAVSGERYRQADPRYPGFVVEGLANPWNKPYRLIDGRRRLHKMLQAGLASGPFLVFQMDDITPYVFDAIITPEPSPG